MKGKNLNARGLAIGQQHDHHIQATASPGVFEARFHGELPSKGGPCENQMHGLAQKVRG